MTDRLLHAVFMADMHCPANVTLIAGGGEPGTLMDMATKPDLETQLGLQRKRAGSCTFVAKETEELK